MKKISKKVRITLIYLIIAFTLLGFMHSNFTMQYIITKKNYINSEESFAKMYLNLVKLPRALYGFLGLGTIWKMYVSHRRMTLWVDWFLQDADGKWHLYETSNHSPNHRRSRSFWDVWFFDLKIAIMQLSFTGTPSFAENFSEHLCYGQLDNLSWKPRAVKAIENVHPKLPPNEKMKKNFNLMTSPVIAHRNLGVWPCTLEFK